MFFSHGTGRSGSHRAKAVKSVTLQREDQIQLQRQKGECRVYSVCPNAGILNINVRCEGKKKDKGWR